MLRDAFEPGDLCMVYWSEPCLAVVVSDIFSISPTWSRVCVYTERYGVEVISTVLVNVLKAKDANDEG